METLYIDRKACELATQGNRLLIRLDDSSQNSFPLRQLSSLVISSPCQLSSTCLNQLGKHGITAVCLNGRDHHASTIIYSPNYSNPIRRLSQYRLISNDHTNLKLCGLLVKHKLLSHKKQLRFHINKRPDRRSVLLNAISQLNQQYESLKAPAFNHKQLLGVEGAGAKTYFAAYCQLFAPELCFAGRNKRPPKDPVNAVLSLTYTLLHYEAVRTAISASLDPMLGVLHKPSHGRESLACDLMELLRASANQWVWQIFHDRHLRADHFTHDKGACLLSKTGRSHYYPAFQNQLPVWRKRLRHYVRILARFLDNQGAEQ